MTCIYWILAVFFLSVTALASPAAARLGMAPMTSGDESIIQVHGGHGHHGWHGNRGHHYGWYRGRGNRRHHH
jgi:hypothetical protein